MTVKKETLERLIKEADIDAAIDTYGMDEILEIYGIVGFVKAFGLNTLTRYVSPEVYVKHWNKSPSLTYAHDHERIGAYTVEQVVQNNEIDQLIDAYNKGLFDKTRLLEKLTELENSLDASNYSFGFSIDGSEKDKSGLRILIRTFTQKMVFYLGKNTENTPIAIPPTQSIPVQEHRELASKKIPIIFSGSARTPIDGPIATEVMKQILQKYSPDDYIIVTGGYPEGIPHLAAQVAKDLGFETAAVVPDVVRYTKYGGIDERLYDEVLKVGDDWGDETDTLMGIVGQKGIAYFIGGGFWTEIEYLAAQKMGVNMRFIERFGGVAEAISRWRSELEDELILDEIVTTSTGEYRITKSPEKKSTQNTYL